MGLINLRLSHRVNQENVIVDVQVEEEWYKMAGKDEWENALTSWVFETKQSLLPPLYAGVIRLDGEQ